MSMNRIQFEPGLSRLKFLNQFGTEVQSESELEQAQWPQSFFCACYTHMGHSVFKVESHKIFQCQAGLLTANATLAGTLFQSTKLPLSVWFLAIYLISKAKTGLSALALKRYLGVSYPTVWLIQHKLMETMSERDTHYNLSGQVQVVMMAALSFNY